jgi:hypothetical protein
MREALQDLSDRGLTTPCQDRPVLFADARQGVSEAAVLCGRGTDNPCPLLELCGQFGYTEGVYADDMVYGGYPWKRGVPLVSDHKNARKKGHRRQA